MAFASCLQWFVLLSLLLFASLHNHTCARADRTGKVELEIKLPCEQVTSAAFGGPNLDILYVTTAAKEFKSPQPAPAGALFAVTGLGVKGTPMYPVDLS